MEFLYVEVVDGGQQTKREISEVWQLIEFITGLPGLFSLCSLGEM